MAEQQKQQSSTLEEKAPSSSSFSSSSSSVPDEVEKFLIFFRMHLQERNVGQLQSIYDVSFPKLTERYYKNSNWPPGFSFSFFSFSIFFLFSYSLFFFLISFFKTLTQTHHLSFSLISSSSPLSKQWQQLLLLWTKMNFC